MNTKKIISKNLKSERFNDNPFIIERNFFQNIEKGELKVLKNEMGCYIFENESGFYIGQTSNLFNRINEHQTNGKLKLYDNFEVLMSRFFNGSLIYDLETKLISHFKCAGAKMHNLKFNQKSESYYMKEDFQGVLQDAIKEIHNKYLEGDFEDVINSSEYALAPHKQLESNQEKITKEILDILNINKGANIMIEGRPGTGKSVIASYLAKKISSEKKDWKILLTSPITHLNNEYKKIFKGYKNISVENTGKIINNFKNDDFDLIIIDEGHRLKRPNTGKASYLAWQHIKGENEMEDIFQLSRKTIMLYDETQICMPADMTHLPKSDKNHSFKLTKAIRGGEEYSRWVNDTLDDKFKPITSNIEVKLKVHNSKTSFIEAMENEKEKNKSIAILSTLDRKRKSEKHNFEFGNHKLNWCKKTNKSWINTNEAKNLQEVGYFNNVQGLELNTIGVNIGKNFFLENGKIKINTEHVLNHFQFQKGKDDLNLKFAKNRLRVLLTRAKKNVHIWIEDDNLRMKMIEMTYDLSN